jgi:two-component system, OmpR family, osmolarity sensor histidine kinase EnvZ
LPRTDAGRRWQRRQRRRQHLVRNGLFLRLFRELQHADSGDHRLNPKAHARLGQRPERNIDVEKHVNTLFARTVLLSVAMLLAVHIGYRLIESISLIADDHASSPVRAASLRASPGASWVDSPGDADDAAGIGPAVSIRPHIVDLGSPVAPSLRAAVWMPAAPMSLSIDALAPGDTDSADTSSDAPLTSATDTRLAPLILSLPAMLIALCAYGFCQTRRRLCELAQLTREADACIHTSRVGTRGACDLSRLARTLSELKCRHHRALDEQSTALAAFSRQIDARVARLRARALNVAQWHKRVAFIEDIDLFSNVARQFVDVAGRSDTTDARVCVDAWLYDRFHHSAALEHAQIVLRLNAGADFTLPRNALERLVGNLVGNALAHGAPPVEICTTRGARTWMLSVRDHGPGISESDLAAGTQPFVRLLSSAHPTEHPRQLPDTAREEHWGLGLSIVSRLARHCGAKLKLGDHPEGGLWARVIVSRHGADLH